MFTAIIIHYMACRICDDPIIHAGVEKGLSNGDSYRKIAAEMGISIGLITKHRTNCLSLVAASEADVEKPAKERRPPKLGKRLTPNVWRNKATEIEPYDVKASARYALILCDVQITQMDRALAAWTDNWQADLKERLSDAKWSRIWLTLMQLRGELNAQRIKAIQGGAVIALIEANTKADNELRIMLQIEDKDDT